MLDVVRVPARLRHIACHPLPFLTCKSPLPIFPPVAGNSRTHCYLCACARVVSDGNLVVEQLSLSICGMLATVTSCPSTILTCAFSKCATKALHMVSLLLPLLPTTACLTRL